MVSLKTGDKVRKIEDSPCHFIYTHLEEKEYDKATIEAEGIDFSKAQIHYTLHDNKGVLMAETKKSGEYAKIEHLAPGKVTIENTTNTTREPESVWAIKDNVVNFEAIWPDGTTLTRKIVIEHE